MNVLHVMPSIDPRFGGPPQALIGYVQAAGAAGWRATIAAPDPGDGKTAWLKAQLPGAELRLGTGRRDLWDILGPLAGQADVVHVHGTLNLTSSIGMWRAIRADRPVIVRPFGTLSRYTFARRRRALKRGYHTLLDAPALRRAAAIHFTTDTERDDALRWDAIRRDRCYVIPPPWTGRGPAIPRTSAGLGAARATVVFLSRLDPKKGLETLLDAWPAIVRARAAARLLIAGDGQPAYRRALEQRVARLGIGETVRFLGFVDGPAKQQVLADADLFVLPSRHENFGVAVIEAVAAGVPVIVSGGVGLAGWVRDNRLGLVPAADDSASLAESIGRALADEPLRARCAQDGPAVVERTFASAVIGGALVQMYDAAIAKHARA